MHRSVLPTNPPARSETNKLMRGLTFLLLEVQSLSVYVVAPGSFTQQKCHTALPSHGEQYLRIICPERSAMPQIYTSSWNSK